MIAAATTDHDMAYVLANLRPASERELFSGVPRQEYLDFLDRAQASRLLHATLFPALPIAPAGIFSVYRVGNDSLAFLTFCTNTWPLVAGPFIRWFNRKIAPALAADGYRRADFMVLDDPPANLRWFELMNIVPSGPAVVIGGVSKRPMIWKPTLDAPDHGLRSLDPETGQPSEADHV